MMAPKRILILLLLGTQPMLAAAQVDTEIAVEPEQPRRYTVEVIVFRYAQEVATGSEIFPPEDMDVGQIDTDDEPVVIGGEALEEIPSVPRRYRDIEFTLLTKDQYTMGDIMERLQRLDVYEPLMHFGWTQATWPDEDTLPIDLGRMAKLPDGLAGTLRLYLSRYLHLVVDLELDGPVPAISGGRSDPILDYGDYRSLDDEGSIDDARSQDRIDDYGVPQPVRYRIEENRILRSDELRYFDHPKFGVLAKVVRVEEEPEAPLESSESELLGYPTQ